MSGQSAGMQIPSQSFNAPQTQSFNQQFGQQQNMSFDSQPRYGQFQNQQAMQQPVQPAQQPNFGLLQPFGGNQFGYRPPVQQQMQQPVQQPAPSLLNQQVPGVQQAPMQQPVQQQPSFNKSGFFPFSPALDSLGNPVTQLRSPELSPEFLNQPPVLGPDLITQNSPGMTSIEPQFDKFGNQIQALPTGISVGVPGTPSYRFSPMIPENMPPRFINTPVGRVSPGGIGGGMSQPGFFRTQPTFAPSDGMPFGGIGGRPFASQQTAEDFQRMQDYRNQDLINQGIRANQGMPMGGAQQPAPRAMPARGRR